MPFFHFLRDPNYMYEFTMAIFFLDMRMKYFLVKQLLLTFLFKYYHIFVVKASVSSTSSFLAHTKSAKKRQKRVYQKNKEIIKGFLC